MSWRERLFEVARAEWTALRRRVGSDRFEPALHQHVSVARPVSADPAVPAHILRYYANLELQPGATAEQVKVAYRRLMREYHPDRHPPERQQVAAEVARELRAAYEGLLEFLNGSKP